MGEQELYEELKNLVAKSDVRMNTKRQQLSRQMETLLQIATQSCDRDLEGETKADNSNTIRFGHADNRSKSRIINIELRNK